MCHPAALLQFGLFLDQPLRVLGREIVIRISKQRFGRGYEFGVVVTLAESGTARRRGHGVNVRIIEKPWVRMVIKNRNLLDLREKTFINLLNVRAGNGRAWPKAIPPSIRKQQTDRTRSILMKRCPQIA